MPNTLSQSYPQARLYERLMAGLFDILIPFFIIITLSTFTLLFLSLHLPQNFWQDAESTLIFINDYPWIIVLILLLFFTILNGYLLYSQSQTLGQKIMDIKIIRCDESRASLLYSLIYRYYLGIGFGLFFLVSEIPALGIFYLIIDVLCIFISFGQCIHDAIADTMVVRIKQSKEERHSIFRIKN